MTKLDMGRAWNDATALLSKNMSVVLIVAAVFFFLPSAISGVLTPPPAELEAMAANPQGMDREEFLAAFAAFYADKWWIIALSSLIQAVGVLALLRLLTDAARPTVGDSLAFGVKALIPYIAVQLLIGLIIAATVIVLVSIGAMIAPAVAIMLLLVSLAAIIYLWVKFSMVSPVIAIEGVMNPVSALRRSWTLTKGNSIMLFLFYLLLVVVAIVVMLVAGMVFSIFALAGDDIGSFVSTIGGSLVGMGLVVIMLAVLAAVHRQLAGTVDAEETFA